MIVWALGLSIGAWMAILYERGRTNRLFVKLQSELGLRDEVIEDTGTRLEMVRRMLENQATTLEVIAGQHEGPKRPRSAFD